MSTLDRPNNCAGQNESDQARQDRCFMSEALALARSTAGRTWPNPPVGAVVVKNGQIVGRGYHKGAGQAHAEPMALAEAGDQARGATLYVTLEPCNHQGRTPPCAPAVYDSGVTRVVVGVRDPNPSVIGGGCRHLRDRGVVVECGVLATECLELIWPFVTTNNFSRVYVELKTAQSLDGRFAPPTQDETRPAPFYLTGEEARRDVHRRRRRVDLVLVGKGTARSDRPCLDGRLVQGSDAVPGEEPLAGYVDTHLEYAGGLDRQQYLVFAGTSAEGSERVAEIEKSGGTVIFCREKGGQVDPRSIMEQAAIRDILSIMVEGGPTLAQSFLKAGVVDRWLQYTAPVVLHGGVGWPAGAASADQAGSDQGFSLTSTDQLGPDLLTVYDRRSFVGLLAQVTM